MDGNVSLFRNSRFLKLWASSAISFAGDAVSLVALPVLMYRLTDSATAVGGILVAMLLPTLASPLVGVLADRVDRRTILVVADLSRAVLTIGFILTRDVATLYVLAFSLGVARTFFSPTILAATPSIVGSGDLARANALIQGSFNVCLAVGPPLGGLLVATVGLNVAFLLDAATFLIAASLLALIPLPRPQREEEESFFRELRAGFNYLARARVPLGIVLGAFLIVLTWNLTAPADVFLAEETFRTGETGFGLTISMSGIGMIAGTALVAVFGTRIRPLALYFGSAFIIVLALAGIGLAPAFVLALAGFCVTGFAGGVLNVTEETILQQRVPDSLLGRVFSVHFLAYNMGDAVGLLAGGLIVDAIGVRPVYVIAGLTTGIVTLLLLWLVRSAPKDDAQESSGVPSA